jgi:hypothetical protein
LSSFTRASGVSLALWAVVVSPVIFVEAFGGYYPASDRDVFTTRLLGVCSLIAGVSLFIRWRRRVAAKSRSDRGLCPVCSYDLTGNTSGICPECGTPVPKAAAEKGPWSA